MPQHCGIKIYFFRFGNCALCTISRKYLLTMSSGLKPFLSYCDEFLDKTFLNVTFLNVTFFKG